VARELVTQIGTRRWARYQLSPRIGPQPEQASRADRRPALLAALGEETLPRAELAARTGLSDQTVRRWLAILRQEGTVELAGDTPRSRHARYRRTHQDPLFPQGHPPGQLPT